MDKWSFYNPTQIEFCSDGLDQIGNGINYQRIGLITTPGFTERGVVTRLKSALGDRLVTVCDTVQPNPDVEAVDATAELLKPHDLDCLIGLGGGSCLDTAKALARVLPQPEGTTLSGHFREALKFKAGRTLPIITVPTTAGTGAEVTPFATIWDLRERKKYSLTGEDLFPVKAVLDPVLTLRLPESLTISTGLDAISHALESIWNKNASPVSIGLATQSLKLSLKALPELKKDPHVLATRAAMMNASLLAGMAISQTRTALAHSISYPLTIRYGLPHGIACSFALPELLNYNAANDDGRLKSLAVGLGYSDTPELADALTDLLHYFDVPGFFSAHKLNEEQSLALTHEMFTPGRADNNMRPASMGDVRNIFRDAFRRY